MVSIPLGINSYHRANSFQPEVRLVNFYMEKDESGASPDEAMRLQRPGLTLYKNLTGNIRGVYRKDGVINSDTFAIAGNTLHSITSLSSTAIGSVPGSDRASFASSFERLGLVADGRFWTYDGVDFVEVTVPDGHQAVDVDVINAYFVVACSDGRFYWLVPGAATIDPLDYATAETVPDGLRGVRRLGDELFFLGTDSVEVWQTTGDADLPFARAAGRTYSRGCLARDTITAFDNSLLWVGEDGIVYRAASVPERISTHGIEERIRKRSGSLSAFVFSIYAHQFYVLRIEGQGSFAFDASTSLWSEFASEGRSEWRPHVCTRLDNGSHIVGDATSGKIWTIDPNAANDDGAIMRRTVSGSIAIVGRPVRNDNLAIHIGCEEDTTIRVRWKDGRDDWPDYWDELEVRSPVDIASLYRLGSSDQPVRTFEIECIQNTIIRLSGATIGEAFE